jgi:hypothetical protein
MADPCLNARSSRSSLRGLASELPYHLCVLRREREGGYLSAKRWNECIAAGASTHQVLIQVDDVRVRPDFIDQHVRCHGGGQLTLVTGTKDGPAWAVPMGRPAS